MHGSLSGKSWESHVRSTERFMDATEVGRMLWTSTKQHGQIVVKGSRGLGQVGGGLAMLWEDWVLQVNNMECR